MTFFFRNGSAFRPTDESALDMYTELPVGNYLVAQQPVTEVLYFEKIDDFTPHGKLYGKTDKHATRIINTFKERGLSTGALLSGEKGCGKTLLARVISERCAKEGIPTIVINQPWVGDAFNQLIQSIQQPAIVMFDEFEKVYDREKQESILTLLDGVFPSKKLFLLTCNDQYRIDKHMRNRPGRIFYSIEFNGLEREFIVEYCKDVLTNTSHIDDICKVAAMFDQFNFDMLKALIEEMNRYDEDPYEALEILNAVPQSDSGSYEINLVVGGKQIDKSTLWPRTLTGTPVTHREIRIDYTVNGGEDSVEVDSSSSDETAYFLISDLKSVDEATGAFTYVNEKGDKAVFTRIAAYGFKFNPNSF